MEPCDGIGDEAVSKGVKQVGPIFACSELLLRGDVPNTNAAV